MADKSPIEWTDATWNPVRGCTRISPGCGGPNRQGGCYAETLAARFSDPGQAFHGFAERTQHGGRWTGKLALIDNMLTVPLRWSKPRRIFVNSMSDLFHENLPDEAIDKVFAVMALCPQHTFQVLTKRSDRMRAYLADPSGNVSSTGFRCPRLNQILNVADRMSRRDHPAAFSVLAQNVQQIVEQGAFPNVWLGVSVEDQQRADERIPDLLETPAAVRFLSCEPLLGSVDLTKVRERRGVARNVLTCDLWSTLTNEVIAGPPSGHGPIDWVITGGESGQKARPAHPDWFRTIRDQCADAGVAYFHKQNGEWAPGECGGEPATRTEDVAHYSDDSGWHFSTLTPRMSEETHRDDEPDVYRFGKKRSGATLDGREHREFPT